jgi:2-keto-4-pentenoate hydratase/2-oxohepta-3-ene-1,7-dioic acid hydratase in catechol pathway
MRIVRFKTGGDTSWGLLQGDLVTPLAGNPVHGGITPAGPAVTLSALELLAPVEPSKIVCVGRNYRSHVGEMGWEAELDPVLFLKPPSAVIATGDHIQLPAESSLVEPEPELAVVIGKRARNVSPSEALDHVFGFVLANDVSARDLMVADGQWSRAKGFDTFCPVGPWIQTELDLGRARLRMAVDDEPVTDEAIGAMRLDIAEIIALASSVFTLEPGDILLTGSPAGRVPLTEGSVVRIWMDDLGVLENVVAGEDGRRLAVA